MRNRLWTRAAVGAGVGLAIALLLGFGIPVFWFPVGVGIAVISGAVIAASRPVIAVIYAWTVVSYWWGMLNVAQPDRPASYSETLVDLWRLWASILLPWAVGIMVIGLVWLIARGRRPTVGAATLLVAGVALLIAGTVARAFVAGGILFGDGFGMAWKVLLLAAAASYAVGFVVALTGARSTMRGFAQSVLLALGSVAVAVSFLLFPSTSAATIWCDFGWAPTRYVPVGDRTTGCTSFRSDFDANWGPDRNDTSWIQGWGLGPEPTPLAVGENWDSPAVPASSGPGLVLMAAGVGFVGLAVGMGMWRRRASAPSVSAP